MDALFFIDIIQPEHDRTSCLDEDTQNGFWSRYGHGDESKWHGRCTRCMYLEIINDIEIPVKFNPDECQG